MKAGTSAILQYLTAFLLVFLISWHMALRFPPVYGVESFPETLSPEVLYKEISTSWLLLSLLLVATVLHGINGIRTMLLEWNASDSWRLLVNGASLLAAVVLCAIGIHTIVAVVPP
ncbi:MAG: hypothetical protein N3F67_02910 [Acidilobaceae archaeon]|nr:hypothetical protein [Acidilobaceae archaeon]